MKKCLSLLCGLAFPVISSISGPSLSAEETASALPSWIWTSKDPKANETIYLRKEVEIPATTKRAVLVTAGDNKIDVFVNGAKRGVSSSQWASPAAEDVSDQVKGGKTNLIAARAQNSGGIGGAFVLLELTHESGKKSRIVSDESWMAASKPEKGWNLPDLDPSKRWGSAEIVREFGEAPWGQVTPEVLAGLLDLRVPQATPVEDIKLVDGFKAELLYSVPKAEQGSWVAMTIDDRQRLIVSDQYGALYRFRVPPPGETLGRTDIEKIEVDIGGAQGLLYAFDALYVVLNTAEHGGRGLYRVTDSDGDDKFDKKELLRKFDETGGEHGPHAVVLGPDGESIYVVVGNQTPVTEVDSSRVPRVWGEDLLLERPIGRGFMKGTLAPGGWIAKTDPRGEKWELIATGFRNEYDIAFNRLGDMFTFDADMEWDMNTPWYRPTRINHVTSGAEFGWRNGGGKWPDYYPDSLPAVVDIGPGSPTGVAFGFRAKFPEKYQKAFYAADWSYGKLYAVHLEPSGASYDATFEEFMSAQPLPLTDLVVNPEDGALYVAIGGRRVQSGLYRITYEGDESIAPAPAPRPTELRRLRTRLESYHEENPEAVEAAWPHLGHADRYIRYAARIAIEHQPVPQWKEKALTEEDPETLINAMIALARHGADLPGEEGLQEEILGVLDAIDMDGLDVRQKKDLLRAFSLAFTRLGRGSEEERRSLGDKLASRMPFASPDLNKEALELLVYVEHPQAASLGIELLEAAPSQEEQMSYAKSLRHLESGWNRALRKSLSEWFARAQGYRGGASFALFVQDMKETALANTPAEEKAALRETIEAEPPDEPLFTAEPRSFVKSWKVDDFDDVLAAGLEGGRDFANGRRMFGAASCFACHRFDGEGGAIGPDLTSVAGQFSPRDLLESILEPSKEISDQYGQMIFEMTDGTVVIGRIMNLSGDVVRVNTNMLNPDEIVAVDRKRLESMKESPVSMMPPGLLDTLTKDDVLDLLAYLLSMGDPDDPVFAE
ncbi:MAG: c-type cytochrome [Verrucomicrobiales bacterium]